MTYRAPAALLPSQSLSTLLPVGLATANRALREMGESLWSVSTVVEEPGLVVQCVDDDSWLTWTLEEVNGHTTRVALRHDEIYDDGPPPELDLVLAALLWRVLREGKRTADL